MPHVKHAATVAIAAGLLFLPGAPAQAAVNVTDAPEFVVSITSAENVTIDCTGGGKVLVIVNGIPHAPGPTTDCSAVTSMTVTATGAFPNTIDLSTMVAAEFTAAPAVKITGGGGNDSITGSGFNERYIFSAGWGTDTVTDGPNGGTDALDFMGTTTGLTFNGSATITDGTNTVSHGGDYIERLVGGTGADVFLLSAPFAGGAGTIDGGGGTNTISYVGYNAPTSASLGGTLDPLTFAAELTGLQEVPPNTTVPSSGTAELSYNASNNTFDLDVFVSGITVGEINGFHIHAAGRGVDGPIIVDFLSLGYSFANSGSGIRLIATGVTFPPAQIPALFAGNTYLNLHTTPFPGGEIRGQLTPGGTATNTGGIADIDHVVGGSQGDLVVGNVRANTLTGNDGGDVLSGGGANDNLLGGGGRDRLAGGSGNDTLGGGRGRDRLAGGAGNDKLRGGKGRDRLFGGPGRDTLIGGPGRDFLRGGPGADILRQ